MTERLCPYLYDLRLVVNFGTRSIVKDIDVARPVARPIIVRFFVFLVDYFFTLFRIIVRLEIRLDCEMDRLTEVAMGHIPILPDRK